MRVDPDKAGLVLKHYALGKMPHGRRADAGPDLDLDHRRLAPTFDPCLPEQRMLFITLPDPGRIVVECWPHSGEHGVWHCNS
jgi:hypothetical protein